jgi:catechol 2,3-dioxygenase-like lactoylglutathione lyase family enzyme
MRVHIALNVRDLSKAVAFYERLFGRAPAKLRPGYAKFDLAEPPVNFTLNESPAPTTVNHLGIEVRDPAAVDAARARLEAAGLETRVEKGVACCYAVQDKVWVRDPDGHDWEVFTVLADSPRHAPARCCP